MNETPEFPTGQQVDDFPNPDEVSTPPAIPLCIRITTGEVIFAEVVFEPDQDFQRVFFPFILHVVTPGNYTLRPWIPFNLTGNMCVIPSATIGFISAMDGEFVQSFGRAKFGQQLSLLQIHVNENIHAGMLDNQFIQECLLEIAMLAHEAEEQYRVEFDHEQLFDDFMEFVMNNITPEKDTKQ